MNLHCPLILAALALGVAQARPPAKTPIIIDHGDAGTPTAAIDLVAIAASQAAAYAALQAAASAPVQEGPSQAMAQAVLTPAHRSNLPAASGPRPPRTIPPAAEFRHLPAGTEMYFFQADDPRARARLRELPPHTEAYCVDYQSIAQVLKLTREVQARCRIQPLTGDELPKRLGVTALPALVRVLEGGGLIIKESH